MLIYKINFNL